MVQERLATSDSKDGWIPHSGGPCPIPDAKAGEYEIKYDDGSVGWFDNLDAIGCGWVKANRADCWSITHYRLINPTPSDAELLRQAGEALRPFADFSIVDNDGSVAGQLRIQPDAEHVMDRDELEELLRPSTTIVASTGNMAFGGDQPAKNKFVTVGDFRRARAILALIDARAK